MPACPYGPHRMTLAADLSCRRCGGDLRLYAALRDLPVAFYNQARRLWDEDDLEAAAGWLHAALAAREELAKYYEHRARDLAMALGYSNGLPAEPRYEWRRQRLRRKLRASSRNLRT